MWPDSGGSVCVDPARALLLMVGLGEGAAVTDDRGRRGGSLAVRIGLMERPSC